MDRLDPAWFIAGAALIWNVIVTINSALASRHSATKQEFAAIERDLAALAVRVNSLEQAMKALPTAENFHALDNAITEMRGGMRVLEAELKPTAISVRRIEEFLLKSKVGR